MTGHQPHPGIDFSVTGEGTQPISIEKVAKGCGVTHVRVVNPFRLEETKKVVKDALEHNGVSVVISEGACPLMERKLKQREEITEPVLYEVDQEICTQCRTCIEKFMCPAFYTGEDKIYIDDSLCNGCGVCVQVCPFDAIKPFEESV
jgi:indolepyruvate ferredoxin oxidoreductase alpha subunit